MPLRARYVGCILLAAMVAENTVDKVVDVAWNTSNKGVRLPLPPARCQDILLRIL